MKSLKQIMVFGCCILITIYATDIYTTEQNDLDLNEEIVRSQGNDKAFERAEKIKKILSCFDCSTSEKKFLIKVLNIMNNPELLNSPNRSIQLTFLKILTPDIMEKYGIAERECLTGYCQRPHIYEVLGKIMHDAIKADRKQLVELLIDVDLVNVNRSFGRLVYHVPRTRYPLILATEEGNKEMVQLLINYGADVNLKTYKDKTALKIAEEKGNTEIIEILKKALADKLFEAIKAGDKDLIQNLIDNGVNVNAKNSYGDTALFVAERNAKEPNGFIEIVEMLKNAGAE